MFYKVCNYMEVQIHRFQGRLVQHEEHLEIVVVDIVGLTFYPVIQFRVLSRCWWLQV